MSPAPIQSAAEFEDSETIWFYLGPMLRWEAGKILIQSGERERIHLLHSTDYFPS